MFDKEYDALGPFPQPPKLKAGETARRSLIVYNDAFSDERVEVWWTANLGTAKIAGEARVLEIALGGHATVEIAFTPTAPGELRLDLASSKGGKEQFKDTRKFIVE